MILYKSCILLAILFYVSAELGQQLKYYETISHVDVSVRRRRSIEGGSLSGTKDVHFTALGRDFSLVLKPGSPVLASGFKAHLVNGDGSSSPLFITGNNFYTGHLEDDEEVQTDAHTEDGMWTANIYEKNETYTLEPSWRYLPPSDNHSMIVYKHSDIKWDNMFPGLGENPNKRKQICKAIHPKDDLTAEEIEEYEQNEDQNHTENVDALKRSKRATSRNTCHILAVADYTFFQGPGGSLPHRAANYVIQTIQRVNRIYQTTQWDPNSQFVNMGIQIEELRIHNGATSPEMYETNSLHYNMNRTSWDDLDLLKQFGLDRHLTKYCLAHLFTHRKFAEGVLGLAYIATARKYALGGICSSRRFNRKQAMNTGFSSTMNTRGGNLLTQEATLVTSHEFGHNWGSEHDAETAECAPSNFKNGKYLMFPFAVSGYDENNHLFSPCSKRSVSMSLAARSSTCFRGKTEGGKLCGNGIVEASEDCDGGLMGLDPCCTNECKLKPGAECSPVNWECCQKCKMAPKGTKCRGETTELCRKGSECLGTSLDCPASEPLADYTECIDKGTCRNGTCVDFCGAMGLQPCVCDDAKDMCMRCCRRPGQQETCEVKGGAVPDGRPCTFGTCMNGGYCKKTKPSHIQRFFPFIENMDASAFLAFMKSNIVGTVIIFSLIIWIPASWTVSCIDKRNHREARENDMWISNDMLLNASLQSHFTAAEEPLRYTARRIPTFTPGARRGDSEHKPPVLREEDIFLLNQPRQSDEKAPLYRDEDVFLLNDNVKESAL